MSSLVQCWVRSWLPMISIISRMGLLIVLLSAGLAACAFNQRTQSGSTATSSTHTQQCGKVQTGPQGTLLDAAAAKQATNCFWQAFQHCHAASLIFSSSGSDTAMIRTFTVENDHAQCSISDAVQDVMGPNPPAAGKTYICLGLEQESKGLHFASCGEDGDIFVPTGVVQ